MRLYIDSSKKDTKLPSILEAAVKLFVDHGIDGTSIRDIAAAAGVAEGALYRHFKSKEDLAWHLFAANLKEYTSGLLGTVMAVRKSKERIRLFVRESFSACERNRTLFYYLILAEHRELKRFTTDYLHPGKIVEQLVSDGQAEGELRNGNPWILFSIVAGTVHRLCILRFRGHIKVTLPQMTDETAETIWKAVRA